MKAKKGYAKAVAYTDFFFNIYEEWIIRQTNGGISIAGEKITNIRSADNTVVLASVEREIGELLLLS